MNQQLANQTSPILRWAGSKRKLLPHILPCIPKNIVRYIEPFAGSCCVFLALKPRRAILSDLNSSLIDTYKTIRKNPDEVFDAVSTMPDTDSFYYQLRANPVEQLDDVSKAARFVYLNRHCFNGVYRTNKSGVFNVPRGTKAGVIPTKEHFQEFATIMRKASLRSVDFEKTLKQAGVDDFVYLDPPYSNPNTRFRGEYGYGSFCDQDLQRLVTALQVADSRGALILLSYNPFIQAMLPNWYSKCLSVRRSVAGFNHQRSTVTEMLFSNRPFPEKK
ncbi:Dam family site-specific DNA-(adenine-N6)-methyltransferase [Methylomonas sp. SURF-2]|uniref:Site-specific DNA-methyltransferase (adenine-specific) n=1 Tax=Methylomonas subterranea TaxID=2952225 RepID=A0ABT1TGZ9_9GAMM|nr:Dam family site-specific DNA-(adenine-N6)-methyltransferase [Methylomonas sp. SURF-2]MCQ8104372.1 Dam family site-specific DNA-(adenine-N6)-methyltransferase [Methylomonas sp. SURF-2]